MTWSPTFGLVTPGPTASTTPAPSWPGTNGTGTGRLPRSTERSVWQIPVATIRTSTSPALGSSSSRVLIDIRSMSSTTAALTCMEPPVSDGDNGRSRWWCLEGVLAAPLLPDGRVDLVAGSDGRQQLHHRCRRALDLDLALHHGHREVQVALPEGVGGVGGHPDLDIDLRLGLVDEHRGALRTVDGDEVVRVAVVHAQHRVGGRELLVRIVDLEDPLEHRVEDLFGLRRIVEDAHGVNPPCQGPTDLGSGELVVEDALALFEPVALEHRQGGVDHRRRPAEIGVIVADPPTDPPLHDVGDQPAFVTARPALLNVRERRDEVEVGQLLADGGDLIQMEEVLGSPGTVEEAHRPRVVPLGKVLQHAPQGGHPGPAPD